MPPWSMQNVAPLQTWPNDMTGVHANGWAFREAFLSLWNINMPALLTRPDPRAFLFAFPFLSKCISHGQWMRNAFFVQFPFVPLPMPWAIRTQDCDILWDLSLRHKCHESCWDYWFNFWVYKMPWWTLTLLPWSYWNHVHAEKKSAIKGERDGTGLLWKCTMRYNWAICLVIFPDRVSLPPHQNKHHIGQVPLISAGMPQSALMWHPRLSQSYFFHTACPH